MKFKLFLIILSILLFSPYINAEYSTQYYAESQTMEYRTINGSLWSEYIPVVNITLLTPLHYFTYPSEESLIAKYEINVFSDIPENFHNDLFFYDENKNRKKVIKNYKYKYQNMDMQEFPDKEYNCYNYDNNGVLTQQCDWVKNGSYSLKPVFDWKAFNKNSDFKDKDRFILGIFTEVLPYDNVEWIPQILGINISEWAWYYGIVPDIYLSFDDSSFNDSSGNGNNMSNSGFSFINGKINSGVHRQTNDEALNLTDSNYTNFGQSNFTILFWYNTTSTEDHIGIFSNTINNVDWLSNGRWGFIHTSDETVDFKVESDLLKSPEISFGKWVRIVVVREGVGANDCKYYINGSLADTGECSTNLVDGVRFDLGRQDQAYDYMFDEIAIYKNYAFTSNDVTADFNNSFGRSLNYTEYEPSNKEVIDANLGGMPVIDFLESNEEKIIDLGFIIFILLLILIIYSYFTGGKNKNGG